MLTSTKCSLTRSFIVFYLVMEIRIEMILENRDVEAETGEVGEDEAVTTIIGRIMTGEDNGGLGMIGQTMVQAEETGNFAVIELNHIYLL